MNNSKDMRLRHPTPTRRSMISTNVTDTKSLLNYNDLAILRQKWDSRQIISSKKTNISRYTLSQKCHKLPLGLSLGLHHLNKMNKIYLKLSHTKTWNLDKNQKSRCSMNRNTEVKAFLRAKESISLSVSKKWSRLTSMNFRPKLSQHLALLRRYWERLYKQKDNHNRLFKRMLILACSLNNFLRSTHWLFSIWMICKRQATF